MKNARHAVRTRASLLVLAFAVGQIGAFIHANALHARCPEHGELAHADGGADAAEGTGARGLAAWTTDLAGRRTPSSEVRGLPPAGEHEHDHCYVTCASRERALTASGSPEAAAPLHARPVAAFVPMRRAPARAVYLVAPKTSPPA